jgi:hypothetical protein
MDTEEFEVESIKILSCKMRGFKKRNQGTYRTINTLVLVCGDHIFTLSADGVIKGPFLKKENNG